MLTHYPRGAGQHVFQSGEPCERAALQIADGAVSRLNRISFGRVVAVQPSFRVNPDHGRLETIHQAASERLSTAEFKKRPLCREASDDLRRCDCRRCFIEKHKCGGTLAVAHTDAIAALNLSRSD